MTRTNSGERPSEVPPDNTVLVSWYDHGCPWVTKLCDEEHRRHAWVPADVLRQYVDDKCEDPRSNGSLMCCSLGHEDVPAHYVGNFEVDVDHVEPNIAYCKECGDSVIGTGEYGVTRTIGRGSHEVWVDADHEPYDGLGKGSYQ